MFSSPHGSLFVGRFGNCSADVFRSLSSLHITPLSDGFFCGLLFTELGKPFLCPWRVTPWRAIPVTNPFLPPQLLRLHTGPLPKDFLPICHHKGRFMDPAPLLASPHALLASSFFPDTRCSPSHGASPFSCPRLRYSRL